MLLSLLSLTSIPERTVFRTFGSETISCCEYFHLMMVVMLVVVVVEVRKTVRERIYSSGRVRGWR